MTYEEFLLDRENKLAPLRRAHELASEELDEAYAAEKAARLKTFSYDGGRFDKAREQAVARRKKAEADEKEAFKALRLASERWHGLQR